MTDTKQLAEAYADSKHHRSSFAWNAAYDAYLAALSSKTGEYREVWVEIDSEEFSKQIEKDGAIHIIGGRDLNGKPRWLKKITIPKEKVTPEQ